MNDENKFSGSLGNYTILRTEDGTNTVYSEVYDENCHSTSGAWEETIYNYVEGTQIIEKLKNKAKINIFEVGFGVGIGVHATLESLDNLDNLDNFEEIDQLENKEINFITTEIDENFAKWTITQSDFARSYNLTLDNFQILEFKAGKVYKAKIKNLSLFILIGDARETIHLLQHLELGNLDCIYQDPFSPKKNHTLWTQQWFTDLIRYCSEDVLLSTYCAAVAVRKALMAAGFKISKRRGFGMKRSATLASLNDDHLPQEGLFIQEEMKKSQTLPLSD